MAVLLEFTLWTQSRALLRVKALVSVIKDALAYVGEAEEGDVYWPFLERSERLESSVEDEDEPEQVRSALRQRAVHSAGGRGGV